MADKLELLMEADRRGILPAEKRRLLDEARTRGLLPGSDPTNVPQLTPDTPAGGNVNSFREIFDPSAQAPNIAARKAADAKRAADLKATRDKALGHMPGVDYDTGLSFMDRLNFSRMDNDEERKNYLGSAYGAENVRQDSRGRFYVAQGDKQTAVFGDNKLTNAGAELLSQATPLTLGSAAAYGASPFGPLASVLAFGAGAGGGKLIDEGLKSFYGLQAKTPAQTRDAVGKEIVYGMAGEGAGKGIQAAAGRLTRGPLPRALSGATDESDRMTALSLRGGAAPPIKSALPDAKTAQYHESVSYKLAGPQGDKARQEFIDEEIKNILRASGVPENKVGEAFESVINPQSRVSTREMGEDIKRGVTAYAETLEKSATKELEGVSSLVEAQKRQLDALIASRKGSADLGLDVADNIASARKDFSTSMSKVYNRVDRIVGDDALVPTAFVKREAQKVLDSLPKNAQGEPIVSDPRVVKVLTDLKGLGDNISFGDAQKIRSTLGEFAELKDLVPGVSKKQYGDLQRSVDLAFKSATADPRAAQAKRLLDAADGAYRDGLAKFKDSVINKLVQDAKTGIPPDPSVIAREVTATGYTRRAEEIKKLVGKDAWDRVAAADYETMLRQATRTTETGEQVGGKSLINILRQRGPMLDTVYGPTKAKELREYAQRLAAKDGAISSEALASGDFKKAVQSWEKAQGEFSTFMKENYLSTLADPKKMPDDALKWIVQPGQEQRLKQAVEFFGDGSPQVNAIRQSALMELLARSVDTSATGTGRRVAGSGIDDALRQYTTAQQEMLFPNGLADDLRLVAKEAKFLFPKFEDDMAGGLHAGAVKAGMPWTLPIYAYNVGMGWILSRPETVRALALGIQGDSKMRAVARQTMDALFRSASLSAVGDTP